jgi:hypothetical protein
MTRRLQPGAGGTLPGCPRRYLTRGAADGRLTGDRGGAGVLAARPGRTVR